MAKRLKADLHTHCADDPCDPIGYSAEMLIDIVADRGFDVLAIACHSAVVHNDRLADYAAYRGVLLIPAIELNIEKKHVVVLNPDETLARARTSDDLRRGKRDDSVVMAPHPFYPSKMSLHSALVENIDVFDAIEYCSLYYRSINFNRKAVRAARKYNLPLIGNSDTHFLPYIDSTFSRVDAEPCVDGVVEAIHAGRVEVETRPRSLQYCAQMLYFIGRHTVYTAIGPFKQEVPLQ